MKSRNQLVARIILTLFALCVGVNVALPTGAPKIACHDMTPRHGNNVALLGALAPYRLNVSSCDVNSGDVIDISLAGLTSTDKFRGFFIQVRQLDINGTLGDDPIGEFTVPAGNVFAKIVDCGDNLMVIYLRNYISGWYILCFCSLFQNAVTHRNAANDLQTIKVQWKIAAPFDGIVEVKATVVRDFHHFWTDLRSEKIAIKDRTTNSGTK